MHGATADRFFRVLQGREPAIYEEILDKTEEHYTTVSRDTAFAGRSTNPMDKRLDFTAYCLALIKTMEERGWDVASIRNLCLEITKEYVKPRNRIHAWFKRLPVRLIHTRLMQSIVRSLNRRISTKGHADGFAATILTDKDETLGLGYGIDITECGICKLFQKHGSENYVPILCEVDRITTTLAGLTMIRSGTIAEGSEICDFRYVRSSAGAEA